MWTAAETGDLATALIPAIWTFLGVVVVTLGTIAVQAQKTRSERRSGASESTTTLPANGNGTVHLLQIARDLGQLDQRANDNDERDDFQDKRLDVIERHLDAHDPEWRRHD